MDIGLRRQQRETSSTNYFFLTEKFLFYRKNTLVFEWKSGQQRIILPFRRQGEVLFSLSDSSFGGIDHTPGISGEQLTEFLASVLNHPEIKDFKTIRIRSYPECYAPERWILQHGALISLGFSPAVEDENRHIQLDTDTFRTKICPSKQRYLNLAEKEGWIFRRLDPGQYLTPSYQLFLEAKAIKGYPMSMEPEELQRMFRLFPENYLLFGIFHRNLQIAASAAIKVNSSILYDFFHGESNAYRKKSPVSFLTQGLFNFARKEGMKLLDLGICSDNGIRNEGLCTFKKELGGISSRKIIYEKQR